MNICATLTSKVNVDIEPHELIDQLFLHYFNIKYENLIKKDNAIYAEHDVSMHGSPIYENIFITNDQNLLKIYDGLSIIREAQNSLKDK